MKLPPAPNRLPPQELKAVADRLLQLQTFSELTGYKTDRERLALLKELHTEDLRAVMAMVKPQPAYQPKANAASQSSDSRLPKIQTKTAERENSNADLRKQSK